MTTMTKPISSKFRASRRGFLAGSAATAATVAAGPRVAFGTPRDPSAGDVIVCVFLRGGADALSMVVPYTDPGLYTARPTIAVPPPNAGDRLAGALDLDGSFGLHPAMAKDMRLVPAFWAVKGRHVFDQPQYGCFQRVEHVQRLARIQQGHVLRR